jgi:hypothetical protein
MVTVTGRAFTVSEDSLLIIIRGMENGWGRCFIAFMRKLH